MTAPYDGVENAEVRAAVVAFVAESDQPRAGGSIEVLRQCMYGHLLLDVTGSDLRMSADGTSLEAGSTIRIATTQDPDGGSALIAFTSQAAIERTRSAAAQTQSMVQSGVEVLELVQSQDHQWLYLDPDPDGQTCALSRVEVDFALHVAHNDAVRAALGPIEHDSSQREALLDALRTDAALVVAVAPGTTQLGESAEDMTEDMTRARTSTLSDGRLALVVFTSGPELLAHNPEDSVVTLSTTDIMDMLRAGSYAGLTVNPAGPSATVSAAELLG